MNAAKRRQIFERFARHNPNPTTELVYTTPFELLVAVVLSAQSTDVGVNKATEKLFKVANTPQQMLALGEEGLKRCINTLNFFNTKARNLIKTCQALVERHGGEVPRDREALESLPGVGRKTANVILNTAFGEPAIAVDTHIFRVSNRTGLAPGATPRDVEDALVRTTPEEFKKNAHHWLILHGRYVCKARKPNCAECIIVDLCEYEAKTTLIVPGERPSTPQARAKRPPSDTASTRRTPSTAASAKKRSAAGTNERGAASTNERGAAGTNERSAAGTDERSAAGTKKRSAAKTAARPARRPR